MSDTTAGHALKQMPPGRVTLLPSAYASRHALNLAYVLELKENNLLQNHYFEAGIWGPPGVQEDIHKGWEIPYSLVRGHFPGHWLSAAAKLIEAGGDPGLRAKADHVVAELARCQQENGGEWVAPIPERYFARILHDRHTWAAQYVYEKTLTGLLDMYRLAGNETALEVVVNATRGLHRWSMALSRDAMDDVLDHECGRMLELFVELYNITRDQAHLDMVDRYNRRRYFERVRRGEDVLTNRHGNTVIPEITGAARAWEVLGDSYWREVTEGFWKLAVTDRGFWATGGQTSGEMWTVPFRLGDRLSDKNQEHCTVYNMMKLAEFLLRWTGDAVYADYRERNLHNGIMGQQHPTSGMVSYFLPLRAGSTKEFGTRTESFFCCHGTLVQANALHGTEVYYQSPTGLNVAQYIPTRLDWEWDGVPVTVTMTEITGNGMVNSRVDLTTQVGTNRPSELAMRIEIEAERDVDFELSLYLPWWLTGPATLDLNGNTTTVDSRTTFAPVRVSGTKTVIVLRLPRGLRTEALPDRPEMVAFMEGPSVLAGLCDHEVELAGDAARPDELLVPDSDREWENWIPHYRTVGQRNGMRFIPISEVTDQRYSIYFPMRKG